MRNKSMGLVFSIMDGVRYLKDNAQQFTDNILILHGKEDGLVSYVDSLQLYQEIGWHINHYTSMIVWSMKYLMKVLIIELF